MKSLQDYLKPIYQKNLHHKHVQSHPHSLFGYCAAAHLRGPKAAVILMQSGKSAVDGTGTPNSYYAHKFGLIGDDCFFQGSVKIPRTLSEINNSYEFEFTDELSQSKNSAKLPDMRQTLNPLKPKSIALPDNTRVISPSKVKLALPGRGH